MGRMRDITKPFDYLDEWTKGAATDDPFPRDSPDTFGRYGDIVACEFYGWDPIIGCP